jgi:hypothetical protein
MITIFYDRSHSFLTTRWQSFLVSFVNYFSFVVGVVPLMFLFCVVSNLVFIAILFSLLLSYCDGIALSVDCSIISVVVLSLSCCGDAVFC